MNFEKITLQGLSLEVIKINFCKYANAFSITNDDCLKKNLLFLQRIYSHGLLTELSKAGQLREEYFDILLNEHLKVLDLGIFLNATLDKQIVIEKLKLIGHNITELSCTEVYGSFAVDVLKEVLPHVPNVTKLFLPRVCNDEILELIASSCSQLTTLDIQKSCNVTGKGLKAFCLDSDNQVSVKCPLKNLNLCDVPLRDADDIAVLLKSVRSLEILNSNLVPSALFSIYRDNLENKISENTLKYNLVSLDFLHLEYFRESQFRKLLKLCVELCPNVKKLSAIISTEKVLELCCRFSQLECLNIINDHYFQIINLNYLFASRSSNLKELTADSFIVCAPILIENCPFIESLVLKITDFQMFDERVNKSLNHLKNLEFDLFGSYDCAESVGALLSSSSNLKHLTFCSYGYHSPKIGDEILKLSLNCKLETLKFENSIVDVDFLQKIIIQCDSLTRLVLKNCEMNFIYYINKLTETKLLHKRKLDISFD